MDRPWRPSTTPQGLSAVHIRPMTPSYTPPQLQLPGIRDPQGITRSRAFRLNVARPPATPTRPSRGPWLAFGLCCPDGSSLTTASSAPRNPSPPLMDSRWGRLHPRRSASGGDSEGPQLTPLDCARAPPPLPRWPRRVRATVTCSSVVAFTTKLRVRQPHRSFRGCRVHSELISRSCYGPRAG
jgi:hypothetical protein